MLREDTTSANVSPASPPSEMGMISAKDLFDSDKVDRWAANVGMTQTEIERLRRLLDRIKES
jgi:hypothetical protein